VALRVSMTSWDFWKVIGGMVGDDEDGVEGGQIVERRAGHVEGVMAALTDSGEEGIVVADDGALVAEQFEDGERRGFAQVVDVAFVGQAEDQDFGAFDGLGLVVESVGDLFDDEVGHGGVDFAG